MVRSLRERRRRQTAREIQMAAIEVTLRGGYDQLTTEAVAAEAGISTRTFFNYYSNKQAALLGEPILLDPVQSGWFVASHGWIVDDLVRLLGQTMRDDPLDRGMLRKIIAVVDSNPALHDLFRKRMEDLSQMLTELLLARLGPARAVEASLLAEMSTRTLTAAVSRWAVDDAMDHDDIGQLIRRTLCTVGHILTADAAACACPD